jgi:hypothetical protein
VSSGARRAGFVACFVFTATLSTASRAHAATVWAIDDGERIGRDAAGSRFASGEDNPVWRPGAPIRLFALRDEVVSLQVVVEADAAPLDGVTVELVALEGAGRAASIGVERFVEHFFEIKGASSTRGSDRNLAWASGSGPAPGRFTGVVPDALIPVERAPAWSPYPMRVAPRQNGVVWIDLTVPREQEAGGYRARVVVRAGGRTLAVLPLALEVLPATLPARPVATMLYYGRGELERRVGGGSVAERQLWTLLHRHRLSPVHVVSSVADVRAHLPALDGSLYTAAAGYDGPAQGVGDGLVVIGMYGSLGDPTPAALVTVGAIADELAAHGVFDEADVVLYAEDEDCRSPRGAGWRAALARARAPNARRVRVAWTCSEDPAGQPVDVPIVGAFAYDPARAAAARAVGKQTWIYAGYRPSTGTVLTDTEAVSLRTLGWIAAMAGTARWFLWETTAWYDGNRGGRGPFDPFVTAETFHNRDGDVLMGDGVLLYPGRQRDLFTDHSVGLTGVLPSIRLKNLRRGIEDAGYLSLARGSHRAEAEVIARGLFPRVLAEARPGEPPAWSERGAPFFEARRALARLATDSAARAAVDPGPTPGIGARPLGAGPPARASRLRYRFGLPLVVLLAGAVVATRALRRRA